MAIEALNLSASPTPIVMSGLPHVLVVQAERPDGALRSFKAKGLVGPNLKLSITSLEGLDPPHHRVELRQRLHLMPSRDAVETYYGSLEDGRTSLERLLSDFVIPDDYTIIDLHGSPDRHSRSVGEIPHDDEDYFYGPSM